MSVNASYRRITVQELMELQRERGGINAFFGLDVFDEEFDEDEDWDEAIAVFQENLEASGRYLDIMNEHQALNFLLTGLAEGGEPPIGNVVEGGRLLGDTDVGYGPPRFLTPEEVSDIAQVLDGITEEEVHGRFDPVVMNEMEIYPANKDLLAQSGWREEDRGSLTELYQNVKKLFQDAAREGDAVLFWYH